MRAALGPSMVLVPLPGDDTSLLGRVVVEEPPPGADLAAYTRPNPCGAYLGQPAEHPMQSRYVDSMGDRAVVNGQLLQAFGFGASAGRATSLKYDLQTTKELSVDDTTDYEACCAQTDCGYGFVNALVYGHGEYAAVEDVTASVNAPLGASAAVGGSTEHRILQSRRIQGYLAISVRRNHQATANGFAPGAPGGYEEPSTDSMGLGDTDLSRMSPDLRRDFEESRILVLGDDQGFMFVEGSGKKITENEFIHRYADVTGSDEVNAYWEHRNMAWLTRLALPLAATGAVLAGTGILFWNRDCQADDYWHDGEPREDGCSGTRSAPQGQTVSGGAVGLFALGSMLLVGGVTVGIVFYSMPNGTVRSHSMSEGEASHYANRYNEALRKRTESRSMGPANGGYGAGYPGGYSSTSGPTFEPWMPTGVGITGQF